MGSGTPEPAPLIELALRPARATAPLVAMVGAGQLARMTHLAAAPLGVRLRVLGRDAREPAVLAGAEHLEGSESSYDDLARVARGADAVTFDHERIPPAHLRALEAAGVRLVPSAAAKALAQDKLHQRRTLAGLGFPVPAFAEARSLDDVRAFAGREGWPLVAKTPTGGYDGQGVMVVEDEDQAAAALARAGEGLLLEPKLDIEVELAVLVARSTAGERVTYPVVETVQVDGMCREVLAPARVEPRLASEAAGLAEAIADAIGAEGILAVELFLTSGRLLVNELALRPHNSGHYTIEGCVTSQFEQHVRSVLGWPLGSAALAAPAVVTVNVVGPADGSDPADRTGAALEVEGAHIHLYGKAARPGRKLGHVTVCAGDVATARTAALRAAAILHGEAP